MIGPTDQQRPDVIADDLLHRIDSGLYKPGEKLPTMKELGAEYDVPQSTVQLAIGQLEALGVVLIKSRQGTFVREYRRLAWQFSSYETIESHQAAQDGADAWETYVKSQGGAPSVQVEVSLVVPPPDVAEVLDVEDDEAVVLRSRRRDVAWGNRPATPYVLQRSYFRRQLVEDTKLMLPGDQTEPGGILAAAGIVQELAIDKVTGTMPTRAEAAELMLPPATPVFRHRRIGIDKDGTAVRCMDSVLPCDRFVLVYEVPMHLEGNDKR